MAESSLPPLVNPAANTGLLEVFRRRYLLKLLVRREISARYSGSVLGFLWSYIQPAVRLLMFYFVFQILIERGHGMENFAIHLFCGLVVVHYFTETFGAGTRSIVANRKIVQKMSLPREMFPVASMLVSAYHVIPGLLLLLATSALLGWRPDWVGMGALVLGFAIVSVLGLALALIFSVANVIFRDFGRIVQTLNQFVTFSVPMIYPYTMVEERFKDFAPYYLWNPVAEAVLLVQRAVWIGTNSDPVEAAKHHLPDNLWQLGFIHLGIALVLLVIAQAVFNRLETKIPELL